MRGADRRVRKTRMQLRDGLADLMRDKSIKEITVKELVEKVDINRSTFYLHYSDIYDMMEKVENELIENIEEVIEKHPVGPFGEKSFSFIEDMVSILAENKKICTALLGPNGDMTFLHRIEKMISEHSMRVLRETYPEKAQELLYSYAFCMSGCVGLIKAWLQKEQGESPQEMANLTFQFIVNTLNVLQMGT